MTNMATSLLTVVMIHTQRMGDCRPGSPRATRCGYALDKAIEAPDAVDGQLCVYSHCPMGSCMLLRCQEVRREMPLIGQNRKGSRRANDFRFAALSGHW
jgi:hypothetical protein